jgi:hypothetical protein
MLQLAVVGHGPLLVGHGQDESVKAGCVTAPLQGENHGTKAGHGGGHMTTGCYCPSAKVAGSSSSDGMALQGHRFPCGRESSGSKAGQRNSGEVGSDVQLPVRGAGGLQLACDE